MNVCIDRAIYSLQSQGGISRLWRQVTLPLHAAMPDAAFVEQEPADVFMSTYYALPANGARSVAVVYDMIAEQYSPIGYHHPDALAKREAIRFAEAVIAISEPAAADVRKLTGRECAVAPCGGGETLARALPSAVDDFRRRFGLDKPYILTVGRRGLYKNVQALYQAWRPWGQAAYLVTVGGEDNLPQDMAFDRAFPGVRKPLKLTDADLACAYTGALALVFPSFMEGFGLPVIEALACGCPVIGGEAIRYATGDAGIYVNVYRPLAIAQGLNEACDPAQRIERAVKGYARAKQFTWAGMAQAFAKVIRSVI